VKSVKKGDWVIPAVPSLGTWRTFAVWNEQQVIKVNSQLPVEYAACLSVNPCTAYRMLRDFTQLKRGDTIIQNGANSAVGQFVYQFAKEMGVKTINIIRDRPNFEEIVERMKTTGADIVVSEDYIRRHEFKRLISDLPAPKLALNCVGGESATNIARALGHGGVLVTYGGMSKKPVQVPTSLLIFKDIQLRGFWMSNWTEHHSHEEKQKMIDEISELLLKEESLPQDARSLQPDYKNVKQKVKLFVERQPFEDFKHAIDLANTPFRNRKIVLSISK